MTRSERRRAWALAGAVAALHIAGFGILLLLVAPQHLKLGGGAFSVGVGADRLHARAAARVRRRPHRGDRQHDAQADGRRPAAAERRLLVLARALERRVRARRCCWRRRAASLRQVTDDGRAADGHRRRSARPSPARSCS